MLQCPKFRLRPAMLTRPFPRHLLFKLALWVLVLLPGIPFVVLSLAYTGYVFWPRNIDAITAIDLDPEARTLVVAAHGVRDSAASWSDELRLALGRDGTQAVSLDWRPYSDSPLVCSVVARRIGRAIGQKVAQQHGSLQAIHAIGHSCGAFVALGICEGMRTMAGVEGKPIRIHTTYLDPVSVYAGFFWRYGVDHFGRCADFSDAYIDTRDGVPGSNELLPFAHTFDVTAVGRAQAPDEPPHNWPARYYVLAAQRAALMAPDEANYQHFPRGQLTVVEP